MEDRSHERGQCLNLASGSLSTAEMWNLEAVEFQHLFILYQSVVFAYHRQAHIHLPYPLAVCLIRLPNSTMADEITELEPSDVTFLQKMKVSGNSAIFKVAVHGRTCVMKVVSEIF